MKTTLLSLALLIANTAFTQSYVFSTFTDEYNELTDPVVFTDEPDWDDPAILITMPFNFQMGDMDVPILSQLGLGAEWGGFTSMELSMAGYYPDVINGENPSSQIAWKTVGNDGNRILKIEYDNAAFYNEVSQNSTDENRVNFQMWFYEVDNAIEFRFGESNITDPELVYDGFQGPPIYIATDVNFNTGAASFVGVLTGDPSNPDMEVLTNFFDVGLEQSLNGTPANGRVYRFAPGTVGVDNSIQEKFSLYPTIAQQELNLRGDIVFGDAYRIISLDGRTVSSGLLSSSTVDVSSLASGTYLFQIDNFGKAQKFVKQ